MQVSLKKLIAINFCILLVLSIGMYVWAQTPTTTFWISSGVYPGAPSYTVWKEGSNYFAKDSNGQIDYSGTNASHLVLEIVNSLTSGGKIFFEQGRYYFDTPIMITDEGIYIEGEATAYGAVGTVFELTGTSMSLFHYTHPGTHQFFGGISNVELRGNDGAGTIAIHVERYFSDLWFENLFIRDFADAGIRIDGGSTEGANFVSKVWNIWIKNCLIEENNAGDGYGIYLTNADSKNHSISRVTIGDRCHFYNNNHSLYVDNQWVFNLEFSGNTVEQEQQESIYLLGGRRVLITNNRIYDIGTDASNTYSAIYISNVSGGSPPTNIEITDNIIGNHWLENQSRYAIQLEEHCDHIRISDNMLETWKSNSPLAPIYQDSVGTDIVIEHNQGFITEARGTASGTTFITVTHTLADIPTNIRITPTSSAGNFYVNTVGATTFRINFDGGGTVAFYWEARCVPDI